MIGLLGWTAAHELSSWLLDHAHMTGSAQTAWRLGQSAGAAALLIGCLAAGSMLAVLASPAPRDADRGPSALRPPLLLSIGGFIATDFAERAVAGQHGLPSVLVLAIGAGVYALIGTAASLLWRCVRGLLCRVLCPANEPPHLRSAHRLRNAVRLDGFPSRHWTPVSAGRAPPTPCLT